MRTFLGRWYNQIGINIQQNGDAVYNGFGESDFGYNIIGERNAHFGV